MYSEVILGLDVSTKCTGICVLEDDGSDYGRILELTHVTPKVSSKKPPIEQLFLKDNLFTEQFLSKWLGVPDQVRISRVVIEEPLLQSNNAVTAGTLLRFNGMVSKSVYDALGIVPEYISSYEARLCAFPELVSARKYAKDGHVYHYKKVLAALNEGQVVLFGGMPWDIDKKQVLWNLVQEKYPGVEWLYKKNGDLKKENFDMSDALVLCLAAKNISKLGRPRFEVSNIAACGTTLEYDISYWGKKWHKTLEASDMPENRRKRKKKSPQVLENY